MDNTPLGQSRDPRLDGLDYRPDVYGQVEASYRTAPPPEELIAVAMNYRCSDCLVNVFLIEDPVIDGKFEMRIAHDELCPWLAALEEGRGSE